MKLFNLTIATDELEKRAEGYKNLSSMLYGFIAALAVAMVTGLWYWLVPRDLNWQVSQIMLVLHLLSGGLSLFTALVFIGLHLRQMLLRWWQLLWPPALCRSGEPSPMQRSQRLAGWLLTLLVLLVLLTGVLLSLPGLLFYPGVVWMQGYEFSQLLLWVHRLAALLLPLPLLVHFLWNARS